MKKSNSLLEHIFKKPVSSCSTVSLNRSSCLLSKSSVELSQGKQVFLFTIKDADAPTRSEVEPNMYVQPAAAPPTPVPGQVRRSSLSKEREPPGSKPCSRVEGWAREFDCLLGDPAGLQMFTEFLKKEFSHENIYFWCLCEKYQGGTSSIERYAIAKEIVERHLDTGSPEPVNVDCNARTSAQESLNTEDQESLNQNMFVAPQKQIYNLMKFDSYGRFLKSDLYNACLTADLKGRKLPLPELDLREKMLFTGLQKFKTDDQKPPIEGRTRRRSFLPWPHKSKSREKLISKSTEELDKRERKKSFLDILSPSVSEHQIDKQQKRNSRSCSDVCVVHELCRVSLPDGCSCMGSLEPGKQVKIWVEDLLRKRGMIESGFLVLDVESGVALDMERDCSKLTNREIKIIYEKHSHEEDREILFEETSKKDSTATDLPE